MLAWTSEMCVYLRTYSHEVRSLTAYAKARGESYLAAFSKLRGSHRDPGGFRRSRIEKVVYSLRKFEAAVGFNINGKLNRGTNTIYHDHKILAEVEDADPGWAKRQVLECPKVKVSLSSINSFYFTSHSYQS
jgi:hypothetical protein